MDDGRRRGVCLGDPTDPDGQTEGVGDADQRRPWSAPAAERQNPRVRSPMMNGVLRLTSRVSRRALSAGRRRWSRARARVRSGCIGCACARGRATGCSRERIPVADRSTPGCRHVAAGRGRCRCRGRRRGWGPVSSCGARGGCSLSWLGSSGPGARPGRAGRCHPQGDRGGHSGTRPVVDATVAGVVAFSTRCTGVVVFSPGCFLRKDNR